MVKITFLVIGILLFAFLGYVASRPGTFQYERSGTINAPAEAIFPYLRNFKLGNQWTPYVRIDPAMKITFEGPESGVGSVMAFEGNSQIGSGRLEILKEVTNSLVEIKLDMFKPMKGSNIVYYKLAPEGSGTRFTWSMSGEGGFMAKLFGVFIDCEKMVGDTFSQGIQNLKQLVESKK